MSSFELIIAENPYYGAFNGVVTDASVFFLDGRLDKIQGMIDGKYQSIEFIPPYPFSDFRTRYECYLDGDGVWFGDVKKLCRVGVTT